MKAPHLIVHSHLTRVSARWRRLKLGAQSSVALAVVSLLALLLGVAMWRGWIVNQWVALTLAVILLLAAGVAFLVVVAIAAGATLENRWLAGASEEVNPTLLDRLNTLTHLEKTARRDGDRIVFTERIRHQTAEILDAKPNVPFSATRTWICTAVATIAVAGTCWFYAHWTPWRYLANSEFQLTTPKPDTTFELAQNQVERSAKAAQPWGEVRITEPGRDLKLTKVDVVAMRIEAASNQGLKEVRWNHSVNGDEEVEHALSSPAEPSYAAYDPVLYLDELRLSEWDVVSYYADADAGESDYYSSDIYFIEIRPFRSDLAKMPGGQDGKAAKSLAAMSDLIQRQQQILRETRRFQGRNYEKEELKKQDREKLGGAEGDLRHSTEAEYARIATTLENQPVGDMLDGLAKAEESMRRATTAINDDAVEDGQQHELASLQDLIATRKNLQKFISEHPEAFQDQDGENSSEAIADPLEALAKVTEFRDRQQAARKGVDDLLKEQQELRDSQGRKSSGGRKEAARTQEQLREKLDQLQKENPDVFRGSEQEAADANAAMQEAKQELEGNNRPEYELNRAVDRMQDLQQSLAQRDGTRSMEQAYRMKQLLDQQTKQMEAGAKGNLTQDEMQKLSQAAKSTTGELKEFAESEPAGFGPQLKDSLSGQPGEQLEQQLEKAGESSSKQARQEGAGQAAESMKKISQAFDQSSPQPSQGQKPGQSGQGQQSGDDPLSRALRELQSLVQNGQSGHEISPEDNAKQREEALLNLRDGLEKTGKDPKAALIVQQAEEELRDPKRPINVEALRKLLDDIENFRVELSDRRQRAALEAVMTHVDRTKVSPIYRDRVQEYYRRLSEQ